MNTSLQRLPVRNLGLGDHNAMVFATLGSLLVYDRCLYTESYFYHSDLCKSREQSQAGLSYAETQQSVRSKYLGSASWITDSRGMAVQHIQYLPYGEQFVNQATSGYSKRFDSSGKEKDTETGFSYFGARYYEPKMLNIWLSVDPMADKYPNLSPYNYCAWNPIKLVDPDGNHIEVVANNNGTYTVRSGQVNNDKNIYIVDHDGNRTGETLGTMFTRYSFFDDKGNVVKGSIINPKDESGKQFLLNMTKSDMSLYTYVFDKEKGGRSNGEMDFKTNDMPEGLSLDERIKYQYRGMPIDKVAGIEGGKVFGSARDIGNYAAGYIAGARGLSWIVTRLGFDGYQSIQNGGIQSEPLVSQIPQRMGYVYGVKTKGYKIHFNIR